MDCARHSGINLRYTTESGWEIGAIKFTVTRPVLAIGLVDNARLVTTTQAKALSEPQYFLNHLSTIEDVCGYKDYMTCRTFSY